MDTEIQQFYRNKCVFLTGGTGFMGLVFIEKMLRSTEVKRIYIIVRPKKGKTIEERFEDMFKNPIFELLKKTSPDAAQRVIVLKGDCALPNLGLSARDCELLIEEVQVVMHCAATVRFDEPLHKAVIINVRATLDLLRLAKQMTKLEAFVYVSTAYANCFLQNIDEKYYTKKLGIKAAQMCEMASTLGVELTNDLKDVLCKHYPNTYTFTKSLAEEALMSEARTLPACIFRPGIVIPTYKEPISGWVGNLYGPSTILYAISRGVLRVVLLNEKVRAQLVPADYCANLMVALPWGIHKIRKQNPSTNVAPPIYNFVPEDVNPVYWSKYVDSVRTYGYNIPLTNCIWYPFVYITSTKWIFYLLSFLYHTMPGYVMDLILLFKGKKMRMTSLYRKINQQFVILDFFINTNFGYTMENTSELWRSMSTNDQRIFHFEMCSMDWNDLFFKSLQGMRLYIGKEAMDTVPKGLKRLKRLLILHRTVQVLFYSSLALLLYTFIKMFI